MDVAFRPEFWMPFFWGLAMLVSWIGWGTLVQRIFRLRRSPANWALRAGWGIALLLLLGGITSVLAVTSEEILLAYSVIGIVAAGWTFRAGVRTASGRRRVVACLHWQRWIALTPVFLLLALGYLGSVESDRINFFDDPPAYMVFIKRLLQTGTIIEPFSVRRMATYGGQQLLQAQQALYSGDLNLNILELGLGPILIAGMLWAVAHPRTRWQRIRTSAFLLLVLVTPFPRVNSQSATSGLFMFLVLAGTLRLARAGSRRRVSLAILAGVVAAAAATLRMNFVPVAVAYLVAAEAGRWLQDRVRWRECLRDAALALGTAAVCLAPWALMLYCSSNTLLFPLMKGNLRPNYAFLAGSMTGAEKAAWVGSYYLHLDAILQLLPLIFVLRWRHWRDRLPLYLVAIVMTVAAVLAYAHAGFENLYRYAYPSMAAAVVLALAYAVRHARRPLAIFVVYATLVGAIINHLDQAVWVWQDSWAMMVEEFTAPRVFARPSLVANYRAAENAIPRGERVFAAVSYPNMLDYRLHTIYNIDTPGVAAPDPGLPLQEGPAALKAYLKSLGIRYMILVDPDKDKAIYARSRWTTGDAMGEAERVEMPFTMAYINDATSLLATEEVVYNHGSLYVLKFR
jgi:hypothetical protein